MKAPAHETRSADRQTEWNQADEKVASLEGLHRPKPSNRHLHIPLTHSLTLITVEGQQHKHGELGGWLTRVDSLCKCAW
jgi:hypothetical protein